MGRAVICAADTLAKTGIRDLSLLLPVDLEHLEAEATRYVVETRLDEYVKSGQLKLSFPMKSTLWI